MINDAYSERKKVALNIATRIYRLDRSILQRTGERDLSKKESACVAIISESHDYLKASMNAVRGSHLRSAGSLLRSLLESTANLDWILADKSGKRAEKYMATTDELTEYMDSLLGKVQLPNQRIPQEPSNWTTSSAEDRIRAHSPQALMIWDFCSHFTHAKPSMIQYLSLSTNEKVPAFISIQSVAYALTTRALIAKHTNLVSDKEQARLSSMINDLMPYLL